MRRSGVEVTERIFVKYSVRSRRGVESMRLTRNAIGYILRGEREMYNGDQVTVIQPGQMYFISPGIHYVEDIPLNDEPFEQILFYYTASQMQETIARMSIDQPIWDKHNEALPSKEVLVIEPSKIMRNFLLGTSRHYEYGGFVHNFESERLHLMELAYSIISYEDERLKSALLRSIDASRADFERLIFQNLFNDLSIEELAVCCNRSLTAFKKEFNLIFGMPPHQWHMQQRLEYAKILLRTTRKSICQVGNESAFPNTSHFIKLFRRYFGTTPAVYRSFNNERSITDR